MSKEIEKRWTNFIKSKSKESNWKFKQSFIFKIENPFLFDSMFFVNGKANSLWGVLHFKLAGIDELFWKLTVENYDIKNYPLSLRVNGSHMVKPINYYNFDLKDITEANLTNLLETINGKVTEVKERFSIEDNYLNYIRENKVLNVYSYSTNLLFCKKYDELLYYIEYCKQNNITSGVSFWDGGVAEDYFDRITNYIHTVR